MTIKPAFNTSELFRSFVNNLDISEKDDQKLRSIRKELRSHLRGGFVTDFADFLQRDYTSLNAQQLQTTQQLNDKRVKFLTQGSFQYRTLNKPQHVPPQQMDMDDGIYFMLTDVAGRVHLAPNLLFHYIESRLEGLVDQKGWRMKHKDTCVRLEIATDKHIDLPLYIVPDDEFGFIQENTARADIYRELGMPYFSYVDMDSIWMAHRKDKWVQSDPRKIIDWVVACKDKYGRSYLTLCRIMKAWRDHQWQSSPLSSICIMRMVEMALEDMRYTKGANGELDVLLYDVIRYMHHFSSREEGIYSPVDPDSCLNGGMEHHDWSEIAKKLAVLCQVMRVAIFDEGKQDDKNSKLRDQFGKFFPSNFSAIVRCAGVAVAVSAPTTVTAARPYCSTDR